VRSIGGSAGHGAKEFCVIQFQAGEFHASKEIV